MLRMPDVRRRVLHWLDARPQALDVAGKVIAALVLVVAVGLLLRAIDQQAARASHLAHQIQESRIESCRSSQARHTQAVAVLQQVITAAEEQETDARLKANTQEAYIAALLVVNALAPKQDCKTVVAGHRAR